MANLPLQDGYETQLSQSWNGAVGTIYVLETPVYLPKTTPTIITVNPGKTNAQLAVISDYDASAKTLTCSAITPLYKAKGVLSTQQSHGTGSKVIISDNYEFWKDLVNITDTQTITGDKTFSGDANFTGEVNMSNVSDLNVNGKSNPAPEVADTTARDALYTAPVTGDMVYVTALNAMQVYNTSTAQWDTQDVGTPAPVATTTTQGIMKIHSASADPKAIVSEEAGTSATPVSTSNKLVDNADTRLLPPSFLSNSDYPAGETLSAGNVVFIENAPTTAQATSAQNIGDVAANTRVSFPVFGAGVSGNTVKLNLAKVGSPSVALSVRIETDNAGSPSGTLVDANATGTVAAASITTVSTVKGDNATDSDTVNTLSSTSNDSGAKGYKIYSKYEQILTTVTLLPGVTATTVKLLDSAGTLLDTKSVVGVTATFSYQLLAATTYRIEAAGTNYQQFYDNTSSFPSNGTNINFTAGSGSGSDTSFAYNIATVSTITSINTVTLSGSLTIPAGQKCHTVVNQVSDTVNASNYYKIGYYTNDTTTRGVKLWNTTYGAMQTGINPYTSSALFNPRILSKTDADFSYKIDWHGISQEAVTAGDLATGKFPKIAISGVDSNQTGMTQGTTMYLGNTAGGISSSAGTNSKKLGKAISDTKIRIVDIPL